MAVLVRKGTQQADRMMHDMARTYYKGTTIYECYKSLSSDKRNSWEKIKKDCEYLNGERLHITGANCHTYSCMYAYPIMDYRTGEIISMMLRKETVGNTYELELPIDEYRKLIGGVR